MAFDRALATRLADVDASSADDDMRGISRLEDANHADLLAVDLDHLGGKGGQGVELRAQGLP